MDGRNFHPHRTQGQSGRIPGNKDEEKPRNNNWRGPRPNNNPRHQNQRPQNIDSLDDLGSHRYMQFGAANEYELSIGNRVLPAGGAVPRFRNPMMPFKHRGNSRGHPESLDDLRSLAPKPLHSRPRNEHYFGSHRPRQFEVGNEDGIGNRVLAAGGAVPRRRNSSVTPDGNDREVPAGYKIDWFDGGKVVKKGPKNGGNSFNDRRSAGEGKFDRRQLGFKKLQEISLQEPLTIMQFFIIDRNFEEFNKPEHLLDFIVLFMRCIKSICSVEFHDLKGELLVRICKSKFIQVIKDYIFNLPYTKIIDKRRNMLFWNDSENFFENLVTFYRTIIYLSPSTAVDELKVLIDTTIMSIDGLQKYLKESFSDAFFKTVEDLQVAFACAMEDEEKRAATLLEQKHYEKSNRRKDLHSGTPPEDFRLLSIYPTKNDLFHKPDFLRPNIVDGAYKDVEHYLDVQFRLMREDFISPLREAIADFERDVTDRKKTKRRYGSGRFYYNVKILNSCESSDGTGVEICFDEKLYKQKNKPKSAFKFSKRFLYGSLILLTRNDFDEILYCTVIDNKKSQTGIISAYMDPQFFSEQLFKDSYLMIESDVYFMPYLHILEALRRPAMVHDFPFENYLIHVENDHEMPKYLNEGQALINYKTFKEGCDVHGGVFPDRFRLGLDESQAEAYITALLREFVIIQGPPGTGKTFIGLKIVETILKNVYLCENAVTRPPILVVCYTNHALDQFLEGLLPITRSIVRIGSQSKNEQLNEFNLKNHRVHLTKSYFEHKRSLESLAKMLASSRNILDVLNCCWNVCDFTGDLPDLYPKAFFQSFMSDDSMPPLVYWLAMKDKWDKQVFALRSNDQLERQETQQTRNSEDSEGDDDDEDEYAEDIDDVHRQHIDLEDMNFDFKSSLPGVPIVNVQELRLKILEIEKSITNDELEKGDVNFIRKERHKNGCRTYLLNVLEKRLQRGDVGYETGIYVEDYLVAEDFDIEQRWALYWKWHRASKEKHTKLLHQNMRHFNMQKSACEQLKQISHLEVLQKSHIVGMTTSGAARLHALLRSLKSPIVIVEEAAEVLETHVVVTLTSACEHVIMIGDHQQLRPITASYNLAKRYNLDISLFERMVKNGNHCVQLNTQHRMRPEISKLITPSIYPFLIDHPSVAEYPNIIGVKKNLFFVDHTVHEKKVEDSTSRSNEHEAHFALNLAKYFVQQGYDPSEITVLATYAGQMFYMREQRKKILLLKNVRIVVLDNYQGEENKIIILSIVRSNSEENIGFLSAVNRVCVALSRAKQGFYIIGNMDILKAKAGLWNDVYNVLQAQDSIGEYLELQCQIHQSVITPVKHADDFMKVAEGGCQTVCNRLMNCGHYCKKFCHITDMEHENTRCMEKCERTCDLNHKCEDLCYKECRCMVEVERELPCGHTHKLPCSQDYKEMQCNILLDDTLPHCQHKVKRPCYQKIEFVVCSMTCEDRLPCGHACRRDCHKKPDMDPKHLLYKCMMDCANLNKDCTQNHECKNRCHEECTPCTIKINKTKQCGHTVKNIDCHLDAEAIECKDKCKRSLPCGHHCKLLCKAPCDPAKCEVKVIKVKQSCGHEVVTGCGVDPETIMCRQPCKKTMSCGHKCKELCYKECNSGKCNEKVENPLKSICGHTFKIPCKSKTLERELVSMEMVKYCDAPCSVILEGCDHKCPGSCGKCWGGTLHIPCAENCGNVLACGHECKQPCRLTCPPCKRKCEIKCSHSKCSEDCGVLCATCKMPCKRSCPHSTCTNKCGEICSVPPCSVPCEKKLKCGHPCRGLCGEKCPDICNICKPKDFPEIFFGNEEDEDARFVKMVDCPCVLEVEAMDTWMQGKGDGEIQVKECPRCKSRVINTPRYTDDVKREHKNLDKAKLLVFGDVHEIREKMITLQEDVKNLSEEAIHIENDKNWSEHLAWLHNTIEKNLKPIINKQNRHKLISVSLTDVNTYIVHLDILKGLSDMFQDDNVAKSPYSRHLIKKLLDYMNLCGNKISAQQSRDLTNCLARLKVFAQATELSVNKVTMMDAATKLKLDNFRFTVITYMKPFDEDATKRFTNVLNVFRKSLSLESLQAERKMIVAAMGLEQGHWFTCPNGHVYCITDCGGAMEVGKCPECGEQIGGSNHRLLGTNRIATFMDGARRTAYPGNNHIGVLE